MPFSSIPREVSIFSLKKITVEKSPEKLQKDLFLRENNGLQYDVAHRTPSVSKTQVCKVRRARNVSTLSAIYHNYYEKGGRARSDPYLLSDYMAAVELAVMHHPG